MAESIGEYDRVHPACPRSRRARGRRGPSPDDRRDHRARRGRAKTIATDGPFAETKEALGGFYIVKAADLDEAIAYAAMIPAARDGCHRGAPDLGLRGRIDGHRRGTPPPSPPTDPSARPPDDPACRPPRSRTRSSTACSVKSSGRAVATLIRVLGDFDLAEEMVQEAFVAALETWPARGLPDNPARVDHDDRPQPGDRPAPPGPSFRGATGPAGAGRGLRGGAAGDGDAGPERGCDEPDRGRPAAADLHVLPSGAADGRPGGADPAHARRPHHSRDRAGVPRAGADARPAPRPGQAQDPRRRDPVPRPARRAAAGTARRRAPRPLPRLQRGLRGDLGRCPDPARALCGGDPPGTDRRGAAPRRARGDRPAGADAPPRRPSGGTDRRGRRAGAARRAGPLALGPPRDRGGPGAGGPGDGRRPTRARTRSRPPSRPSTTRRRPRPTRTGPGSRRCTTRCCG